MEEQGLNGPEDLYAVAPGIVEEAVKWMEENNANGVVLSQVDSVYPGYEHEGSEPWFAQPAAEQGLHILYRVVDLRNSPTAPIKIAWFVILSRSEAISPEELWKIIRSGPTDNRLSLFPHLEKLRGSRTQA